jgi:hypothetical protein
MSADNKLFDTRKFANAIPGYTGYISYQLINNTIYQIWFENQMIFFIDLIKFKFQRYL